MTAHKQFNKFFLRFSAIYFLYYFVSLYPYANELFSISGSGRILFSYSRDVDDLLAQLAVIFGVIFSPFIAFSMTAIWSMPIVFFVYMYLGIKNLQIFYSPEQPFLLWALILLWVELWAIKAPAKMGRAVAFRHWFLCCWTFAAISYASFGYYKINYVGSEWRSGSAVQTMVNHTVFGRLWLSEISDIIPKPIYQITNWVTIAIEFFAMCFMLGRRLRLIWWWSVMLLHTGLLFVIGLLPVNGGMILFHLSTCNRQDAQNFLNRCRKGQAYRRLANLGTWVSRK